jgi:hypothetical protein
MKRRLPWLAGFGLLVSAAVVAMFLPLSLHPGAALPDDGDALQGLCVLAWVAHQAPRAPLQIFDSNLYYPHPKGLVYSEHLIPQGLVVASLLALGLTTITAVNLLVALTIVSIAVAVALWAREIGASRVEAAVAGLVCALGTATLEEISRVQMLWMQWIPLGLYCLHRFFRTGSLFASTGFAACFVLQGLSGQYYLVSYPLYLGPICVAYLYLFPERIGLRNALRLAVPLFLGALLLVPVEWQYLEVFSRYGFRRPLTDGTDLLRYLVPPADNLLYRRFFGDLASSTVGANHHFIGFLAFGLAAVGVYSLRPSGERGEVERRYLWLVAFLGVLGLLFLVLSAGAEVNLGGRTLGPGPFRLLYHYVPFFEYTRVPERLSVYFVFGFALLVGRGASTLSNGVGKGWARAILLAATCVLVPLEHARSPRETPIPSEDEIPDVYRWLAEIPGDFAVVELPVYPRKFLRWFGYESYFSTKHWKRIPFGKASFTPPAFEYIRWTLSQFPSRESTRLLQSLGVRMIIYHPRRDPESDAAIRRLRRDPYFSFVRRFPPAGAAAASLEYGDELVFQIAGETPPPAEPRRDERQIPTERWSFETSSKVDPRLAVDGRIETGWTSAEPQRKGHFFEVDLGREHQVSRIALAFASPYDEFPRALSVNGFHESRRWERIELDEDPWRAARIVEALVEDPKKATMDLVLETPSLLSKIRLFIRETDDTDDLPKWSIPEIRVYESALPP